MKIGISPCCGVINGKNTIESNLIMVFFGFFVVLGLELRAFPLSHSTSPTFCDRVFLK
jgi:hypothetical protein